MCGSLNFFDHLQSAFTKLTLTNVRNAGYCFVDFGSPAAAAKALTLAGSLMPNSTRPFKLNWASGGGLADRRYIALFVSIVSCLANESLGMTVVLNTQSLLATLDLK